LRRTGGAVKAKKSAKKQTALQEKAFRAMKVAVRKAIREKMRAGLPVYVGRDGKVVNLNPKKRRAA
jgi:methionine synthase II (cobalamin-independent)